MGELKRFAVSWPNRPEVGAVESGDSCRSQTFGDGDQACVGAAERQFVVTIDELTDALPIGRYDRLHDERSIDDCVVERCFGVGPQLASEQMRVRFPSPAPRLSS